MLYRSLKFFTFSLCFLCLNIYLNYSLLNILNILSFTNNNNNRFNNSTPLTLLLFVNNNVNDPIIVKGLSCVTIEIDDPIVSYQIMTHKKYYDFVLANHKKFYNNYRNLYINE